MAAQLLEEGDRTQADVFFSQDAGALGRGGQQGRLAELAGRRAGPGGRRAYRADDGQWVATSARARVIAYDPRVVAEAELPRTIDDVVDPRWRGRDRLSPRPTPPGRPSSPRCGCCAGEDFAARLAGAASRPTSRRRYDNNIAILNAVNDGQLPAGLINHYYWYEKVAEVGPATVTAKLHYVAGRRPARR